MELASKMPNHQYCKFGFLGNRLRGGDLCAGGLLGSTLRKKHCKGVREKEGQRRKLNCNAVTTEASNLKP